MGYKPEERAVVISKTQEAPDGLKGGSMIIIMPPSPMPTNSGWILTDITYLEKYFISNTKRFLFVLSYL